MRWIEEPLHPDDTAGYETLCAQVRGTLIASGEHEYTRFGFADLIRRKAIQVLQPDISWSGGFTELRRIATLADQVALPLVQRLIASGRAELHAVLPALSDAKAQQLVPADKSTDLALHAIQRGTQSSAASAVNKLAGMIKRLERLLEDHT